MSDIDFAPARPGFTKASNKRLAILDAAKRAFVRDGVASVSIDSIAIEAGVSRQTVYNQYGDKNQLFGAVVEDVTARSSASLVAVLASFPSHPDDIQAALVEFAVRLLERCVCDIDGRALIMLLEKEAYRYPDLFQVWKEYGPGKDWPLIAGHFSRLAHDGYLDIDDSSLAARQFMALIRADLPNDQGPCVAPSPAAVHKAASAGVSTFLRAFGARQH